MGQKIHPYGLRLGIVTDWKSRWYSEKDYAFQVNQDYQIRKYLTGELRRGAVSRIDIERIGANKVQVDVHTGRPGVVIGRGGSEAERLRTGLEKLTDSIVKFNVIEVQNVELDATLLARSVADQLEGRVSFRRAMKRAVSTALKAGAEGVRVQASGRLGGADMGRREWYLEGRVPLHTLRADIDYGKATAHTTVGTIGVQVWVYKGDLLPSAASSREKIAAEARLAAGGPAKRRRSAKSRAEAAAGDSGPRLIEAGGGRRIVEAGGGKRRPGGRRLIEAGGGRKLTTSDAASEFEAAREEAAEVIPEGQARPPADAPEVVAEGVEGTETVTPASDAAVAESIEAAAPVADADASVEADAADSGAADAEDVVDTEVAEAESVVETEAAGSEVADAYGAEAEVVDSDAADAEAIVDTEVAEAESVVEAEAAGSEVVEAGLAAEEVDAMAAADDAIADDGAADDGAADDDAGDDDAGNDDSGERA